MTAVTSRGADPLGDRWWSRVAPVYDPAVALVGWHRRLRDLVADVDCGRVLDVGCGPAYLAPLLARRGVDYVGVDRNAAMVARAVRRAAGVPGRPTVLQADIRALPFRDSWFDLVVVTAVLGLLGRADRNAALREIARVTRGQARLLEPVHRPGRPRGVIRSRLLALGRDCPIELAELSEAGLDPVLQGPSVLAATYSVVHATPLPCLPEPGRGTGPR